MLNSNNMIDILEDHSLKDPHSIAYTFLKDGEDQEENITWLELVTRIKSVAAGLQHKGKKGDRVVLTFLPGIDFVISFFACIYAGMIAVPAYPPLNQEQSLKLDTIINDAKPTFFLSSKIVATKINLLRTYQRFSVFKKISSLFKKDSSHHNHFVSCHWQTLQDIRLDSQLWTSPKPEPTDLIFLQYTSGSTGNPKGVMVNHANLLANLKSIKHDFGISEASTAAFWLPPYHDMGLIGGLITSAYCHYQNVFMSPMAFIQKPVRWLKAISKYHATLSGAPNFAYDLCTKKITDAEKIGLDLSSWDVAFNGSDIIHENTLRNFAKAFSAHGFKESSLFPCYGMAEATLYISGAIRNQGAVTKKIIVDVHDQPAEKIIVSSGRITADIDLKIVNPENLIPCKDQEIGEIWIAGENVSTGYWQKSTLNKELFQQKITSNTKDYFRTGDLGFIENDQVFVMGRIKEIIIIRGRKFHPEDIEKTVETSHPNIRKNHSVAFGVMQNNAEKLIVVSEVITTKDASDIPAKINLAVIEHIGIPVDHIILVNQKSIKKTTSGKLRRVHTRDLYLENKLIKIHEWFST